MGDDSEMDDGEINEREWLGGTGWIAWALAAIAWAGVAIALQVILQRA